VRRILLLLTCLILASVSCTSVRVTSHGLQRQTVSLDEDVILLKQINVIDFDGVRGDDIGLVMDRKLRLNLLRLGEVSRPEMAADRGVCIVPELIVREYEKNFKQRYYYLLHVEVMRAGSMAGSFHYEYNGTASLFNSRLQNALIRKFMKDLERMLL